MNLKLIWAIRKSLFLKKTTKKPPKLPSHCASFGVKPQSGNTQSPGQKYLSPVRAPDPSSLASSPRVAHPVTLSFRWNQQIVPLWWRRNVIRRWWRIVTWRCSSAPLKRWALCWWEGRWTAAACLLRHANCPVRMHGITSHLHASLTLNDPFLCFFFHYLFGFRYDD